MSIVGWDSRKREDDKERGGRGYSDGGRKEGAKRRKARKGKKRRRGERRRIKMVEKGSGRKHKERLV